MLTPQFASLGTRLIAQILDGIFMGIIIGIALLPLLGIGMSNHSANFSDDPYMVGCLFTPIIIPYVLAIFIGPLVYDTLFIASTKQATLGMLLFGIKVVTEDGNRLSMKSSLIRALIKYITYGSLLILWLWPFFNDTKQALHDLAARSYVVNKN